MSTFNETITLTNIKDRVLVEVGARKDVRSVTLDACVDTGAWTLVINEEVRAQLGLELEGSQASTMADGTTAEYALTEGVELRWKDRRHIFQAQVIPTADGVLFGVIPMEVLDLIADPVNECLRGRHGDKALHIIKSAHKVPC